MLHLYFGCVTVPECLICGNRRAITTSLFAPRGLASQQTLFTMSALQQDFRSGFY